MAKTHAPKKAKNDNSTDSFILDDDAPHDDYKVKLEVFEGPLDLLLFLIKKDEIDIYNIPIARITKQYLEYIKLLESLNIEIAGDFLVMAATLIYIKSKMLLPPDPKTEGEEDLNEDPRAELVNQLLEYQKFKAAANMLYEKAEVEAACFTRGALETDKSNPEVSATVVDLLRVFKEILDRTKTIKEMEILREEMSIGEKIKQIRALLDEQNEISVRTVFELASTKRELILTFLAFLELVKKWQITLTQSEIFGDIIARARADAPELGEVVDTYESNPDTLDQIEAKAIAAREAAAAFARETEAEALREAEAEAKAEAEAETEAEIELPVSEEFLAENTDTEITDEHEEPSTN